MFAQSCAAVRGAAGQMSYRSLMHTFTKNKPALRCLSIFLAALSLGLCLTCPAKAAPYRISMLIYSDIESLYASAQGFQHQLFEEGIEAQYRVHTAFGNMTSASGLSKEIAGSKPDMIVAIGTSGAQACVREISDIPVLFIISADPMRSGLVDSLEAPGRNASGVLTNTSLRQQLEVIRAIQPNLRTLGILYNPSESNSVSNVEELKGLSKAGGITLVEAVIIHPSGVSVGLKSLEGKVDAIYIPADSTVISRIDSITEFCVKNAIPLYSSGTTTARRGSIATYGADYYEAGRQLAKMAGRVLRKEVAPDKLPVEKALVLNLVVNMNCAEKLGVSVPESVLKKAAEIVGKDGVIRKNPTSVNPSVKAGPAASHP